MVNLHECCGVFGVYAPGEDVARLTFFGLFALQHRGQESAGIATTDGGKLQVYANMGLVSSIRRGVTGSAYREYSHWS